MLNELPWSHYEYDDDSRDAAKARAIKDALHENKPYIHRTPDKSWPLGEPALWLHGKALYWYRPDEFSPQLRKLLKAYSPVEPDVYRMFRQWNGAKNPWRLDRNATCAAVRDCGGSGNGDLVEILRNRAEGHELDPAGRWVVDDSPRPLTLGGKSTRDCVRSLLKRKFEMRACDAYIPFRLRALLGAPILEFKPAMEWESIRAVANVGAGNLLEVRVLHFREEAPGPLVVLDGCLDGCDVRVSMKLRRDDALDGTSSAAVLRMRRRALARRAGDDDDDDDERGGGGGEDFGDFEDYSTEDW